MSNVVTNIEIGNLPLCRTWYFLSTLTATPKESMIERFHSGILNELFFCAFTPMIGFLTAWAVEVAERTASLVAKWQGVGFTHGVLNTDNMSILGLTIDYGPFGFLDAFDPSYTPNTTDLPGRRYCFANQPDIGLWNIAQFTRTLSAAQLIDDKEANYAMER